MYKKLLGYSLVEVLVVLGVFSILSVIATQSVLLTLRSSKKSESVINVKQELNFAADVTERQLQNAVKIIIDPVCTLSGTATVSAGYISQDGSRGDIGCLDMSSGVDKRVASSSGSLISYEYRLTSKYIDITSCSFTCFLENNGTSILFDVTAGVKGVSGAEGTSYTTSRRFMVRGASGRY